MERYNKSTMPENAEKYFMTHRGIRTHNIDNILDFSHPGILDIRNSSLSHSDNLAHGNRATR